MISAEYILHLTDSTGGGVARFSVSMAESTSADMHVFPWSEMSQERLGKAIVVAMSRHSKWLKHKEPPVDGDGNGYYVISPCDVGATHVGAYGQEWPICGPYKDRKISHEHIGDRVIFRRLSDGTIAHSYLEKGGLEYV